MIRAPYIVRFIVVLQGISYRRQLAAGTGKKPQLRLSHIALAGLALVGLARRRKA
jgi:hypothetical protein